MDYRTFNVRRFLYVLIHTGVGHTDNKSAHFLFGKTHKFFLCSGWDLNLWSLNPLDLEADALPIEPPTSPYSYMY